MDFEDLMENEAAPIIDIKVVGVGGGGGNAVNRIISQGVKKVKFIAMNTDIQALQRSKADIRLPIGKLLTGGLGAGGQPETGEKAAIESADEIRENLKGANLVFITAGMGGGTGTGGAPVVAKIAKELGALTIAFVTTPFAAEGKRKLEYAITGLRKLKPNVDVLIRVPNEYLMRIAEKGTDLRSAFLMADDVLRQGIQSISELITEHGEINVDFADVRSVLKGQGDALMGIGTAKGPNRVKEAVDKAINNPMLAGVKINGAKNVLISLTGNNISMQEFNLAMATIQASCDPEALIIDGMASRPEMGEYLSVTVIATGFAKGVHDDNEDFDAVEFSRVASQHVDKPALDTDGKLLVMHWQDMCPQLDLRAKYDQKDLSIPAVLRYKEDN